MVSRLTRSLSNKSRPSVGCVCIRCDSSSTWSPRGPRLSWTRLGPLSVKSAIRLEERETAITATDSNYMRCTRAHIYARSTVVSRRCCYHCPYADTMLLPPSLMRSTGGRSGAWAVLSHILYHIILYYIILYYTILYCISYCVISCHMISYPILSYHTFWRHPAAEPSA